MKVWCRMSGEVGVGEVVGRLVQSTLVFDW